jgi:hypothetical protein
MTPMFSAYVVVGEPPTELASAVPIPSAAMARPITGSRSWPVISATALTCPVFSAIRAMTAGRTSRMNTRLKLGRCQPTTSLPSTMCVCGGNPIQSAALTPAQLIRSCVVTFWAAGSYDVIGPKIRSKSHDSTNPKTRPRNTAMRPRKPRKPTAMQMTASMVSSATHWSCGQ